ncbi:helix-turn-helix domain-containing protein [Trinickia fusca]|nr:helix-turn-helix domain-containing protein [Trinickia fusca]
MAASRTNDAVRRPPIMQFDDPVRPYRFSLAEHGADDRLDAWRAQHQLSAFSLVSPLDANADYRFSGYKLGQMSLGCWQYTAGRADAPPLVYALDRPAATARRDGFDNYALNFRMTGSIRGEASGQSLVVGPDELAIIDQSQPYRREIVAGNAMTLLIARDVLPPMPKQLHGMTLRGGATQLLTQHLANVCAQIETLSPAELPHVAQSIVHLVAAVLAPTAERLELTQDLIGAARFRKVKAHIEAHLTSDALSPDSICKAVGVSRSNLYRLFERDGGVASYIRRRRLAAIHDALATPGAIDLRISDLAHRYGFTSPAQLSRAFRQQYGHAPRDTIEAALATGRTPSRATPGSPRADYGGWLADLR